MASQMTKSKGLHIRPAKAGTKVQKMRTAPAGLFQAHGSGQWKRVESYPEQKDRLIP